MANLDTRILNPTFVTANEPAESSSASLTDVWHYTIIVMIQAETEVVKGEVRHECSVGDINNDGSVDWMEFEKLTFDGSGKLKFDASNVGYNNARIVVSLATGDVTASAYAYGKSIR